MKLQIKPADLLNLSDEELKELKEKYKEERRKYQPDQWGRKLTRDCIKLINVEIKRRCVEKKGD